jgi:hypothetical protein
MPFVVNRWTVELGTAPCAEAMLSAFSVRGSRVIDKPEAELTRARRGRGRASTGPGPYGRLL